MEPGSSEFRIFAFGYALPSSSRKAAVSCLGQAQPSVMELKAYSATLGNSVFLKYGNNYVREYIQPLRTLGPAQTGYGVHMKPGLEMNHTTQVETLLDLLRSMACS